MPTTAGVPLKIMMGATGVIGMIAMLTSLFCWLLIIPTYIFLRLLTEHDDRIFRKIALWVETKLINQGKGFWNASSYGVGPKRKRKS